MTIIAGIQDFEKPICYRNNPLMTAQYILKNDVICEWKVTNSEGQVETEYLIYDFNGKCKTNLVLGSFNECLLVIATGDYKYAHCLDFIKVVE